MPPIDAILLLRLAYISSALLVLLITSIPPLRSRFLDYGARTSKKINDTKEKNNDTKESKNNAGVLISLLDKVASIRVPHSWFTSFYAISVLSSLFWASEILSKGPAFQILAQNVASGRNSMTFEQVIVTWFLMFAQGSRRLYECIIFSKPSSSKMWVGHWVLGMMFYVGTGIAVWIEGVATLQTHTPTLKDLSLTAPSPRTILAVSIFILASGVQHDVHAYLASLKKPSSSGEKSPSSPASRTNISSPSSSSSPYQFPTHPAFNLCLTPHYLAECLIYFSLSILAAPRGSWLNSTIFAALVFVAVNLGVTAEGTRRWYWEVFGKEVVGEGRARMVPGVW